MKDNEIKFNRLPKDNVKIIFDWNDIGQFWFRNKEGHGQKIDVQVNSMPFTQALEIQTVSEPPHDHYLRLSLNTPIPLKQNDVILISFYARTTQPNSDGEGRIGINLQRSSAPWSIHMDWPLTITTEWKRYYVPFAIQVRRGFGMEVIPAIPADGDANTFAVGEVRFGFLFGYKPQTIQIADLRGVNYGPDLTGEVLPYTSIKETTDAVLLSKKLADSDSSCPWNPAILSDAQAGNKYLPNFSYAGYHFGEDPLPTCDNGAQILNLTDYGAIPNDGSDDTSAIRNAITEAENVSGTVILQFPSGTIKISEILFLKRDNLIMRGAGSGINGTVLEVSRAMEQMEKPAAILGQEQYIRQNNIKTSTGDYHSPFSYLGGVIWIDAPEKTPAETLTNISGVSIRGSHKVTVDSTSNLEVGQVVQIQWDDGNDGSPILPHIFDCEASSLPEGFGIDLFHAPQVWQNITIESIEGNTVTFKEPINHDLRTEWNPHIRSIGFIREVGLEGFTIRFPESVYAGHHLEKGYNAVYLHQTMHSWVRDIEIINCDSGVIADHSKNITVKDVTISGRGGHYSLMARFSDQVLFRDFEITAGSLHTPSFNTYCRSSVYTHGKILNPQLDQHNGMNHQNLWDDLELNGYLGGLWIHGGNASVTPTHGAFNVAWHLRFKPNQNIPTRANDIMDGPSAFIVGLTSSAPLMFKYGPNAYLEGLNKLNMAIPSLYEYQLNKRIGIQLGSPHKTMRVNKINGLDISTQKPDPTKSIGCERLIHGFR